MPQAMSWEEWAKHDAAALAARIRAGELTGREAVAQAAAAVARLDPQLEAVLGLYEDILIDPDWDLPDRSGKLYGVPMFLKDLGSGLDKRVQESGSKLHAGHVVPGLHRVENQRAVRGAQETGGDGVVDVVIDLAQRGEGR